MAKAARRRLILHVGQAKAGSTAIQNYLTDQRAALCREGILFPETYFARRNSVDPTRSPGHIGLIAAAGTGDLSVLEREFEASKADTLVLSVENLFADQPVTALQAVADRFTDWETHLITVLRHPKRWIVSRYIEEVVSGIRFGDQTLTEFIDTKVDALLYADRIDTLKRVFQPKQMLLLNYDSEVVGKGLILAFLEAANIPVTNNELAKKLRSNVREKFEYLIESKRRLNVALPRMPVQMRQEFEASIRNHARQMSAEDSVMSNEMPPYVQLPNGHHIAVDLSNQRLATEFGLTPPFSETQGVILDPKAYRQFSIQGNNLFTFGLKTAAQLFRNHASQPDAKPKILSTLLIPGSEMLVEFLAQAQVSLHLDSPETATWAASYSGKLPILLTEKTTLAQADQLLAMKLPSEILLGKPGEAINLLLGRRPPNIIVAPVGIPIAMMASLWAATNRNAVLALVGHDLACANEIADRLDLTCQRVSGRVSLFAPRKHTA